MRIDGLDAVAIADAVRRGELSAVAVMNETLAGIHEKNPSLNALVALHDQDRLVDRAHTIDLAVAHGDDPGVLAGVPIAVKDVESVEELPTRSGSLASPAGPATRTTVHISRLESAGAIVVGKTNVPEFGYSIDSKNRLFGQTRNPVDPARSPGGSSGGSAAAVSSRMVPLATGSDGGGSIRIPAAFCGILGLKPSFGRVPLEEDSWGDLSHVGPLAMSVRDVARYLDVASGPSSKDRLSLPAPVGSFEEGLASHYEDLRVLASLDLTEAFIDSAVETAFLQAVDTVQSEIVSVVWAKRGLLPNVDEAFMDLASYRDGTRLPTFSAHERAMLSHGYVAWCERGSRVSVEQIAHAEEFRDELFQNVEAVFDDYDVLITPTMGILPWVIGETPAHDPVDAMMTHAFNLTGHPAISIPTSTPMIGLQAVTRRFGEAILLGFADRAMRSMTAKRFGEALPA